MESLLLIGLLVYTAVEKWKSDKRLEVIEFKLDLVIRNPVLAKRQLRKEQEK